MDKAHGVYVVRSLKPRPFNDGVVPSRTPVLIPNSGYICGESGPTPTRGLFTDDYHIPSFLFVGKRGQRMQSRSFSPHSAPDRPMERFEGQGPCLSSEFSFPPLTGEGVEVQVLVLWMCMCP